MDNLTKTNILLLIANFVVLYLIQVLLAFRSLRTFTGSKKEFLKRLSPLVIICSILDFFMELSDNNTKWFHDELNDIKSNIRQDLKKL